MVYLSAWLPDGTRCVIQGEQLGPAFDVATEMGAIRARAYGEDFIWLSGEWISLSALKKGCHENIR